MNSPKCLRLINTFKTPKRHLANLPNSYLDVGWIYQFTPWTYSGLCKDRPKQRMDHRRPVPSPTDHPVGPLSRLRLVFGTSSPIPKSQWRELTNRVLTDPFGIDCHPLIGLSWAVLAPTWVLLNEPWMVLGDVGPNVSNPNMIIDEFRNSHMNFI